MKVQFSDLDEFFEELCRDAIRRKDESLWFENIERNLLRVTKSYQPTAHSPIVYLLQVIAGDIVRGQLIELTHTLGDVILGRDPQAPPPIEQRADALVADIAARAEALGLEVRAGRFVA